MLIRTPSMQELLYANKLKARRQVLGLDDEEAENHPQKTAGASAADTSILQGKLASVVHKTAVAKLPSHTDMRLSMLRAAYEVAIEASNEIQQAIISSYVEDLGDVCFWVLPVCLQWRDCTAGKIFIR